MTETTFQPAPDFALHFEDGPWPFALANAAAIDRHWEKETAANPALFNGKVLVGIDCGIKPDGAYRGRHISVEFKAFLAWRDWGFDPLHGRNIFASALIRPRDGGFVMGRMAAHTSNAGRIYPPSGTLDHSDVAGDGTIDLMASMRRELEEETGLRMARFKAGPAYLVEEGAKVCLARVFDADLSSDELIDEIRANLERQDDRELEDAVHVTRGMAMPEAVFLPYVRRLVDELG